MEGLASGLESMDRLEERAEIRTSRLRHALVSLLFANRMRSGQSSYNKWVSHCQPIAFKGLTTAVSFLAPDLATASAAAYRPSARAMVAPMSAGDSAT